MTYMSTFCVSAAKRIEYWQPARKLSHLEKICLAADSA